MAKIYIDTRDNNEVLVCIRDGELNICKRESANKLRAQTTLPLIQELLKKSGMKIEDISDIEIEKGPGSFTGLRVGMAIANAFSMTNLVKINGEEVGNIETPSY